MNDQQEIQSVEDLAQLGADVNPAAAPPQKCTVCSYTCARTAAANADQQKSQ